MSAYPSRTSTITDKTTLRRIAELTLRVSDQPEVPPGHIRHNDRFANFIRDLGCALENVNTTELKLYCLDYLTSHGAKPIHGVYRLAPVLSRISKLYTRLRLPDPTQRADFKECVDNDLPRSSVAEHPVHLPVPREDLKNAILAFNEARLDHHRKKLFVLLIYKLGAENGELQPLLGSSVRISRKGVEISRMSHIRYYARTKIVTQLPFGADPRLCAAATLIRWIERVPIGNEDPIFCQIDAHANLRLPLTPDGGNLNNLGSGALATGLRVAGYSEDICLKYTSRNIRMAHLVAALEAGVPEIEIAARMGYSCVGSLRKVIQSLPYWDP